MSKKKKNQISTSTETVIVHKKLWIIGSQTCKLLRGRPRRRYWVSDGAKKKNGYNRKSSLKTSPVLLWLDLRGVLHETLNVLYIIITHRRFFITYNTVKDRKFAAFPGKRPDEIHTALQRPSHEVSVSESSTIFRLKPGDSVGRSFSIFRSRIGHQGKFVWSFLTMFPLQLQLSGVVFLLALACLMSHDEGKHLISQNGWKFNLTSF